MRIRVSLAAPVGQMLAHGCLFPPDPDPDSGGEGSYPIMAFGGLLPRDHHADMQEGAVLKDVVGWTLGEGQRYSTDSGCIPLPADAVSLARAAVDRAR